MTIKELATNWIENDRDGEFSKREISVDEARTLIGYMDDETLSDLDGDITPETFAAVWNDLVRGNA